VTSFTCLFAGSIVVNDGWMGTSCVLDKLSSGAAGTLMNTEACHTSDSKAATPAQQPPASQGIIPLNKGAFIMALMQGRERQAICLG